MSEEPRCVCAGYSNAGDAAPRLWECPSCGKTSFIGPMMLMQKVEQSCPELTKDQIWDRSKGVLDYCRDTLPRETPDRKIFFCEDRWSDVLGRYWRLYSEFGEDGIEMIPMSPGLLLKELKVDDDYSPYIQRAVKISKERIAERDANNKLLVNYDDSNEDWSAGFVFKCIGLFCIMIWGLSHLI